MKTLILILLCAISVSAQNTFTYESDFKFTTDNGAWIRASSDNPNCEVCPGNMLEFNTNPANGLIVQHSYVQLFYPTLAFEVPVSNARFLFGITSASTFNYGELAIGNNRFFATFNAAHDRSLGIIKADTSDNIVIGGTYAKSVFINANNSQVASFEPNGLHITGGVWINGNSVAQVIREQNEVIAELAERLERLESATCR